MKARFCLLASIVLMLTSAKAQTNDTVFVYLDSGGVDVYPSDVAKVGELTDDGLKVVWSDGATFNYDAGEVERVSGVAPDNLPYLTSLKINNKYNDQVYTDVEGIISGDSVYLQIGCIGKWLTPSFKLSDDMADAYIGNERQSSKFSRHCFENDKVYTVAMPDMRILRRNQLTEEVWSTGEDTVIPLDLTVDQLSTNAPSNYDEGLDKMLDGDPATFFHSTWGQGAYQKLPENECPYIDIRLNEPLLDMQWTMTTRSDANRMPLKIELLASADGSSWRSIATYTTSDGLPVNPGGTFVSPTVNLGEESNFLRIKLLEASYKNYFCVAELSIAKVILSTEEPQLIEPATFEYVMEPYGRDYKVHVEWLADNAENVPAVYINTQNGEMISSKTVYLDAEITIDGAGVFPSMSATPVQIKGRGNSSWNNNQWSKNPYRLKFAEKMKPFGLTKGKNWVLLANSLTGSMMSNAVGMKAACLAGTAWANHVIPVELYINGQYRGNYNFTEKVGFSNNSINLEDESNAVLLELDTYYDETYKFRSNPYNLPVNIKKPDFSEGLTNLTQTDIVSDFNKAMSRLKSGSGIEECFDLDYLARFLMVSELIENFELMHPKSTFLYKENLKDGGKYIFGPVWDLDWAFAYQLSRAYCTGNVNVDYFNNVNMESTQWAHDLRYACQQLDRAYYKVWTLFMTYGLDELLDYCEDYYAYARPSFENNQKKWGDGANYAASSNNFRNWLEKRAKYIYQNLTAYELTDEELVPLTGIGDIHIAENQHDDVFSGLVDVYNIQGQCVKRRVAFDELRKGLKPGIYIVNGKKMMVK